MRRLMGDVTTARLLGRVPVPEDEDDLVRIWTDDHIDEDAWPADLRTSDDARRVLDETLAHWDRWGFGAWTVVERATRAVIGRVGLSYTHITGRPEVEVAWFIDPDAWGRGFATEMAREAVRAGFEQLELDELIGATTAANAPSQAVLAKLGFEPSGVLQHAGLPHLLFRLGRPG